jgi:glycosyltransferase involved in cell wall biosynthesis
MKILFVIPEYLPNSGGGIATFYRSLIPELILQGYEVDVLVAAINNSKQPIHEIDNVNVQFLDPYLICQNLDQFTRYSATPELRNHLAISWAAWQQVELDKFLNEVLK